MPKNTFLLIAALAVFAALVIGVNIGRTMNGPTQNSNPAVSVTPAPSATPTPKLTSYTGCGIAFEYPETLSKLDIETGGAIFVNTSDPTQSIAIACQKDIPRPALTADDMESVKIGSVSATLYHDTSAKDGTKIDKLLFRHPKTGLDVYISGFGNLYTALLSGITLQ